MSTSEIPSPAVPRLSRRLLLHLAVAVGLSFLGLTALCVPFVLTGADVPGWLLLVGRWIPAGAGLTALILVPVGGAWPQWWRLRPGGWRGFLKSYGWAVGVMAVVLILPASLTALFTPASLVPWPMMASASTLILGGGLVFVLSTVGEEAFWRGHMQTALRSLGFWRSSLLIGVIWMLWHFPLHAVYWVQSSMPVPLLLVSTVSLLAWAPLLAALTDRGGSIWAAAFAHAVPVSAVQLVHGGAEQTAILATVTGLSMACMLSLAWLLRRTSG